MTFFKCEIIGSNKDHNNAFHDSERFPGKYFQVRCNSHIFRKQNFRLLERIMLERKEGVLW